VVVGLYQPLADDDARTTLVVQATSDHALPPAVASEDKEERTVANPLFFAFAKVGATSQYSIAAPVTSLLVRREGKARRLVPPATPQINAPTATLQR